MAWRDSARQGRHGKKSLIGEATNTTSPNLIDVAKPHKENLMTSESKHVVIAPPNLQRLAFMIYGTAPYVQHKFSTKTENMMLEAQMASKGTKRGAKNARDPEADFLGATHRTEAGGYGIPAGAIRSACISACKVAGFQMTKAKLSVFIETDEYDDKGTPLVPINGIPEISKEHVRLASGVASIAIRPMWREWSASVNVRWDGDQFTESDIANLLERAGQQVGIGEGRPDSKQSHGMGWGTFTLMETKRWQPKKSAKKK